MTNQEQSASFYPELLGMKRYYEALPLKKLILYTKYNPPRQSLAVPPNNKRQLSQRKRNGVRSLSASKKVSLIICFGLSTFVKILGTIMLRSIFINHILVKFTRVEV